MDNRKWEADAIASPPTAPVSPSDGYPTNGNPLAAQNATEPGEWWFHAVGEEIRAVIVEGGLTPNISSLTQLRDAIKNIAKGGDYKDSVRVASTANVAAISGLLTVDGVTVVAGDRVLLKDQSTASQNGIYVAAAGAWSRAADADTGAELNGGAIIPVEEGTVNGDTNWQITNNGVVTIGVTGLTFLNISAPSTGYLLIKDEKATNANGGSSVTTAMPTAQTRVLNTVIRNTIFGASLSSNQITLPAGTYRFNASAPAAISVHKAFLYNVTDSVVVALGSSDAATVTGSADGVVTRSFVEHSFTIASTKVYELRHYTSEVYTNLGLGVPVNNAGYNEVYSIVEIVKES